MAEQSKIDYHLLNDLAPAAEKLLDRHVETSHTWYPHQFVPWSLGRTYNQNEQWDPNEFPIPSEVRSALYVNLLTEDNLPYYVRDIDGFTGKEGIWKEWTNLWASEEARHSNVLRSFVEVTRAIDPVELEDARLIQMGGGEVPEVSSSLDGFVYVALQELATRIAHLKTAQRLKESVTQASSERYKVAAEAGYMCMRRTAIDENFHFLFYRDLVSAAIERDPSSVVVAVKKRVYDFEMPGTGIPGFKEHAKIIAAADIYSAPIHYKNVLLPVLKHWNIPNLTALTPEAAQAQDDIMRRLEKMGKIAVRLSSKGQLVKSAELVS